MKLPLATLTALAAFATIDCHFLPPFGKGPLYEDIQYFIDFIPLDKILGVVLQYSAEDAEFQSFLKYLQGDEFKTMVTEIEAIPETHDFVTYLQDNGIDMYEAMDKLNKQLNLPPYQPLFQVEKKITGGLKGLFDDVKALIDYDPFIHGYVYKMRTSPAFQVFVGRLKSQKHQHFVDALYSVKSFLHVRSIVIKSGIDITLIEDIIYTVLGVKFPVFDKNEFTFDSANTLSKDIHDFGPW